jgi:antitoxin component YwqK of YwqJK toxin-antitoxin module
MEAPAYDPSLACGPSQEMERQSQDRVTERFQYCLQGGLKVKDGTFESRYPSKRLKEAGRYAFNRKIGQWVSWYPDGKPRVVSVYVDGKLEGVSTEYYPSGKVMDEFKYHDGRIDCRDGYHRSYYRSGRPRVDLGVKDGRLVKYVIYDEAGKALALPAILKP